MGLAHRIIPTLLQRGDTLVKGEKYNGWRSVGHVQQAIKTHQARGVDELVILDIAATPEKRGPHLPTVDKLCKDVFVPITVGGGVSSIEDIRQLLTLGADKVEIGTAAALSPEFIMEAANRFGSQAVVVSIDCKGGTVWTHCGTRDSGFDIKLFAGDCEYRGAGEILLNHIDGDGTMHGFDLELIKLVSKHVSIPVVACGGCGTPRHALEAIQAGASAVAIGAMFQFTDETPKSVAKFLEANGVEVRL